MVVFDGQIDIRQSLRLDALTGVDDQQRAFTGRQAARHFIGKVDMAGRVDQVQGIGLAVIGLVQQANGLRLDGDAAFAFQIHRIQNLFLHFTGCQPTALLNQPVGQRRFAVVDMRDNREIADQGRVGHCRWVSLRLVFMKNCRQKSSAP